MSEAAWWAHPTAPVPPSPAPLSCQILQPSPSTVAPAELPIRTPWPRCPTQQHLGPWVRATPTSTQGPRPASRPPTRTRALATAVAVLAASRVKVSAQVPPCPALPAALLLSLHPCCVPASGRLLTGASLGGQGRAPCRDLKHLEAWVLVPGGMGAGAAGVAARRPGGGVTGAGVGVAPGIKRGHSPGPGTRGRTYYVPCGACSAAKRQCLRGPCPRAWRTGESPGRWLAGAEV